MKPLRRAVRQGDAEHLATEFRIDARALSHLHLCEFQRLAAGALDAPDRPAFTMRRQCTALTYALIGTGTEGDELGRDQAALAGVGVIEKPPFSLSSGRSSESHSGVIGHAKRRIEPIDTA